MNVEDKIVYKCLLNNQSQIMATLMLLVRKSAPDLVGSGGEVNTHLDELLDRYKATGRVLELLR